MNNIPPQLDPNKYPDFWEQMENFKQFAKSVGQDVVKGNPLFVSEEVKNKRLSICDSCSKFDKENKRCYICGCFMENKVNFKTSSCPAHKW